MCLWGPIRSMVLQKVASIRFIHSERNPTVFTFWKKRGWKLQVQLFCLKGGFFYNILIEVCLWLKAFLFLSFITRWHLKGCLQLWDMPKLLRLHNMNHISRSLNAWTALRTLSLWIKLHLDLFLLASKYIQNIKQDYGWLSWTIWFRVADFAGLFLKKFLNMEKVIWCPLSLIFLDRNEICCLQF